MPKNSSGSFDLFVASLGFGLGVVITLSGLVAFFFGGNRVGIGESLLVIIMGCALMWASKYVSRGLREMGH